MTSAARATPSASPVGDDRSLHTPILRISKQLIRDLARRPSTSIVHLKEAAEADPAVTLNLFARVNSMLKRAGHDVVPDVSRAILFLGIQDFITDVETSIALEDVIEPQDCGPMIQMLASAHHASRQGFAMGRLVGGVNCDEIVATTLTTQALAYMDAFNQHQGKPSAATEVRKLLPGTADDPAVSPVFRTCVEVACDYAAATDSSWNDASLNAIFARVGELIRRDPDNVASSMLRTTIDAARMGVHFGSYAPIPHLMALGLPTMPGGKQRVANSPSRKQNQTKQAPMVEKPSPVTASAKRDRLR
ncbi:MAG: hypothetical protein ACI9BW_000067 [Gammaproteobacteria bacterium]|jgi:hypothetical protein